MFGNPSALPMGGCQLTAIFQIEDYEKATYVCEEETYVCDDNTNISHLIMLNSIAYIFVFIIVTVCLTICTIISVLKKLLKPSLLIFSNIKTNLFLNGYDEWITEEYFS